MGKYCSFHSHKHLVAQCRTMNDSTMSNRTLITNSKRCVGIYMQCTIILDIGEATNDDRCCIGAYDGIVPDTCAFANSDVAYHHCTRCDKYIFFYGWQDALLR